jgi:antitoxin Phd
MPTIPTWPLQEAQSRFSELIDRALDSGPQLVTRHNHPLVIVISYDAFQALAHPGNLSEFLLASPLAGSELKIERVRSLPSES